MENVLNVGQEEYVASTEPGQSYLGIQLRLLWYLLLYFYAVIIGTVQIIYEWIFDGRSEKSLDGQVVLVTGGGNGLGRAICFQLAKEKCCIAIADVDIGAAEKTASDLHLQGVKAKAYKVDVSNYQEVLALRSHIQKDFGCVDILINNAGLVTKLNVLEGTAEDVQKVIDVNIVSNIWTTRVFLKDMIAQKRGHIVGISSTFGMYPNGRSLLYSTSKYAVRGFMSCLGEELRLNKLSSKIKTTCVYPLFISTRNDLMSVLVKMKIFDKLVVMSPKFAAKEIVNAIKKEKLHASIPGGAYTLSGLLAIMPRRIMEKYMDSIIGDLPPTY